MSYELVEEARIKAGWPEASFMVQDTDERVLETHR
jgi:hypothetical protein